MHSIADRAWTCVGMGKTSMMLAALWFIVGCAEAGGPLQSARDFKLLAYGNKPLPADVGVLVQQGSDTVRSLTCHILVTSGALRLDRDGSFALTYRNANSCNGSTLNEVTLAGLYSESNAG